MTDLLFAVPWWIPTLLGLIGLALLINGNKSQVIRLRNAGAALILLAVIWGLVSYFVDTDKEKVEKGTRRLVQSVVQGDWKQFQSLLTPTAIVSTLGRTHVSGADMIARYARTSAEVVHLNSANVQNLTVDQTGTLIAAHCDIFSTQEAIAAVETSTWQFDWERTNEGWKVREIRLLALQGIGSDQLSDVLPRAK